MADLSITAGFVVFASGIKDTVLAAGSITPGQGIWLDANGNANKTTAAGTQAQAECVGIALNSATAGQPVTYAKNGSVINIGATTAKTTTYMVSANTGAIAPQADLVSTNKIVRLGYATDTAGTFVIDIKSTGAVV